MRCGYCSTVGDYGEKCRGCGAIVDTRLRLRGRISDLANAPSMRFRGIKLDDMNRDELYCVVNELAFRKIREDHDKLGLDLDDMFS